MRYLTLLSLLLLAGCSKTENNAANIATGFSFSVKDAQGNDLLNPENPNAIKESEIRIFYLIDGKVELCYKPLMTYPYGFMLYQHENEYRIGVHLNDTGKEEYSVAYIRWNEYDTDTLRAEIYRSSGEFLNVLITKLWLNEELVWEDDHTNTLEMYYGIVK